jgi:hypothetical protein
MIDQHNSIIYRYLYILSGRTGKNSTKGIEKNAKMIEVKSRVFNSKGSEVRMTSIGGNDCNVFAIKVSERFSNQHSAGIMSNNKNSLCKSKQKKSQKPTI